MSNSETWRVDGLCSAQIASCIPNRKSRPKCCESSAKSDDPLARARIQELLDERVLSRGREGLRVMRPVFLLEWFAIANEDWVSYAQR